MTHTADTKKGPTDSFPAHRPTPTITSGKGPNMTNPDSTGAPCSTWGDLTDDRRAAVA